MSSPTILYGCASCKEQYKTREEMKVHFGTPYHAFNVERKVAGLPRVDLSTYNQLKGLDTETDKAVKYHCKICKKTYATVPALSQHLKSQKHLQAKKLIKENPEDHTTLNCKQCGQRGHEARNCPSKSCTVCSESGHIAKQCPVRKERDAAIRKAHDEPPPVFQTVEEENKYKQELACVCLFCDGVSETVQKCLRQMFQEHSFRLPCWELVNDPIGLMCYLHRKIRARLCLWCGEHSKNFVTVRDVREHMFAKGHNQINWIDDVDEYAEYYNMPHSNGWTPDMDVFGEATLPDGRKIVSRRGDIDAMPRYRGLIMDDRSLQNSRLLLQAKADRHQMPLSVIQKYHLGPSELKRVRQERKAAEYESERMWLKTHLQDNGPMFHGHLIKVRR